MMLSARCAAVIVAVLTMLPVAASAAVPQKSSAKLPSDACKLLTLAQVQAVLPGATDGEPIHDKASKEEICDWEVALSADYLQVTLRPFTAGASNARALYGTTDPDDKVKGLGNASAFASNDSDYTVRAVLGKVALLVKLERDDYDQGNSGDVAELKADATSIATQVAKNL